MKKKWILVFMMILTMGMTACSSDSKESAVSEETVTEQQTENEETTESTAELTESTEAESEIKVESDPITGIVEKYEDQIITIKDPGDGLFYYFSTKNTQIAEEDSHIAVGDKVEITYQGLLGNEKNPGEAVKLVVLTVE